MQYSDNGKVITNKPSKQQWILNEKTYNNSDNITDKHSEHVRRQFSEQKRVARSISFKHLNTGTKTQQNCSKPAMITV